MIKNKRSSALMLSGILLLNGCAGAHIKGDIYSYVNNRTQYPPNTLLIVNVTQSVLPENVRKRVYKQEMLATTNPDNMPAFDKNVKKAVAMSQLLQKNQAALADNLVTLLDQKGIRAVSSMDLQTLPPQLKNAPRLYLNVNISRVTDGNRPLRIFIGWGLGKSKLQTEVNLEDKRFHPPHHCLNFTVHTDSGWMPGVFGFPLPLTLIGFAMFTGAQTGLDIYKLPDATGSAQKIAPEVENYYIKQHWLPDPSPKTSSKKIRK